MAGEKLTDIVKVVTEVKPHHKAYIVDTDDTTDDPAGSSAQIEVYNLVGNVLLQRITLSTAGEFDFDNIPQDYQRIRLTGHIRSGSPAANGEGYGSAFLNDEVTPANYLSQHIYANGTSRAAFNENANRFAFLPATNAAAMSYSPVSIAFEAYSATDVVKIFNNLSVRYLGANLLISQSGVTATTVTAPITRIRLSDMDGVSGLMGTLSLYGER